MKFVLVSGSQREASSTLKLSRIIRNHMESWPDTEASVLSLHDHPLPLWDESAWDASSDLAALWRSVGAPLDLCDALVILSPEWGGMAPSALKNFFLFCGSQQLGHKPALIVSVSSVAGGSYPVAELRMSSYKNNRICYLPEHVIIRNVEDFIREYDHPVSDAVKYLRKRLHYSLSLLQVYARAFRDIRSSGVIDYQSFPFGM